MYRIEEYSSLINTYIPLKTKYKTYEEAKQKLMEQKNKHSKNKYRVIKEEFITEYECKVTVIPE